MELSRLLEKELTDPKHSATQVGSFVAKQVGNRFSNIRTCNFLLKPEEKAHFATLFPGDVLVGDEERPHPILAYAGKRLNESMETSIPARANVGLIGYRFNNVKSFIGMKKPKQIICVHADNATSYNTHEVRELLRTRVHTDNKEDREWLEQWKISISKRQPTYYKYKECKIYMVRQSVFMDLFKEEYEIDPTHTIIIKDVLTDYTPNDISIMMYKLKCLKVVATMFYVPHLIYGTVWYSEALDLFFERKGDRLDIYHKMSFSNGYSIDAKKFLMWNNCPILKVQPVPLTTEIINGYDHYVSIEILPVVSTDFFNTVKPITYLMSKYIRLFRPREFMRYNKKIAFIVEREKYVTLLLYITGLTIEGFEASKIVKYASSIISRIIIANTEVQKNWNVDSDTFFDTLQFAVLHACLLRSEIFTVIAEGVKLGKAGGTISYFHEVLSFCRALKASITGEEERKVLKIIDIYSNYKPNYTYAELRWSDGDEEYFLDAKYSAFYMPEVEKSSIIDDVKPTTMAEVKALELATGSPKDFLVKDVKMDNGNAKGYEWFTHFATQELKNLIMHFEINSSNYETAYWQLHGDLAKTLKNVHTRHFKGNVTIESMVFGAGKSYRMNRAFDPHTDLVIVNTRALREKTVDDLVKFKKKGGMILMPHSVNAKTFEYGLNGDKDHRPMISKFANIFIDEAFCLSFAMILGYMASAPNSNFILLGDPFQCEYLEQYGYLTGIQQLSYYINLFPNIKISNLTYRCGTLLTRLVRKMYPIYDVWTHPDVKHQTHVKLIDWDAAPKDAGLYMSFTKKTTDYTMERGFKTITVRAAQGQDVDKAVLFVRNDDVGVFSQVLSLGIVALSRARHELLIVEVDKGCCSKVVVGGHNLNMLFAEYNAELKPEEITKPVSKSEPPKPIPRPDIAAIAKAEEKKNADVDVILVDAIKSTECCAKYTKNPHCRQNHNCKKIELELPPVSINDKSLRIKYRRRKDELKTTCHWGQRKLLISEIQFLTTHAIDGAYVVYIGAAPGTHIPILAQMFPKLQFHLYDPGNFLIEESENVKIHNIAFNNDVAHHLRDSWDADIIFISDIRTADHNRMDEAEVEKRVHMDMQCQRIWGRILKPTVGLLKFRLPYMPPDCEESKYTYLDGTLMLPVWSPQTSTECRLEVSDFEKLIVWDPVFFQDAMFAFQTEIRPAMYLQPNSQYDPELHEHFDKCYDCTSEKYIVADYYTRYPQYCKRRGWTPDILVDLFTATLGGVKRFKTANPEVRKQNIEKTQGIITEVIPELVVEISQTIGKEIIENESGTVESLVLETKPGDIYEEIIVDTLPEKKFVNCTIVEFPPFVEDTVVKRIWKKAQVLKCAVLNLRNIIRPKYDQIVEDAEIELVVVAEKPAVVVELDEMEPKEASKLIEKTIDYVQKKDSWTKKNVERAKTLMDQLFNTKPKQKKVRFRERTKYEQVNQSYSLNEEHGFIVSQDTLVPVTANAKPIGAKESEGNFNLTVAMEKFVGPIALQPNNLVMESLAELEMKDVPNTSKFEPEQMANLIGAHRNLNNIKESTVMNTPLVMVKKLKLKIESLMLKRKTITSLGCQMFDKMQDAQSGRQALSTSMHRNAANSNAKVKPIDSAFVNSWTDVFNEYFLTDKLVVDDLHAAFAKKLKEVYDKYNINSMKNMEPNTAISFVVNEFLKTQLRAKDGEAPYKLKNGQPISAWRTELAREFSVYFAAIENILVTNLRDNVFYAPGKTHEQMEEFTKKFCQLRHVICTDGREWDSMQNPETLKMVTSIYKNLMRLTNKNFDAPWLDAFLSDPLVIQEYIAIRTKIKVTAIGFTYENEGRLLSGSPDTLFSNCLLNMFEALMVFPLDLVIAFFFQGDDNLIDMLQEIDIKKLPLRIVNEFFPIELKVEQTGEGQKVLVPEFCKQLITLNVCCYDPTLLCMKILSKNITSEKQFYEYQTGVKDLYRINYAGKEKYVAAALKGRYQMDMINGHLLLDQIAAFSQISYNMFLRYATTYEVDF